MVDELNSNFGVLKAAQNKNGTFLGRAHQYFIKLKSIVTGGDVDAIIKEVKRGENTTIEAYKEVLSKQLHEVENNLSEIDSTSTGHY